MVKVGWGKGGRLRNRAYGLKNGTKKRLGGRWCGKLKDEVAVGLGHIAVCLSGLQPHICNF